MENLFGKNILCKCWGSHIYGNMFSTVYEDIAAEQDVIQGWVKHMSKLEFLKFILT